MRHVCHVTTCFLDEGLMDMLMFRWFTVIGRHSGEDGTFVAYQRHEGEPCLQPPASQVFIYPVAERMLMGPASALQGDGWHQGKPGNAVVIDLKTFTGRIIAYIACQVRFNLSSQSQWNKLDGHFDYQVFFWHLSSVVLDNAAGISPAVTPSASSGMTHLQRLQASRAATDARAAAAEAEAAEAEAAAAAVAAAPSAT
ncbi:hypothetical protein DFH09DRAFT_1082343 [Mycena vulgaris]|nr:hypothetical protein DFH09DRAFT_1082343 [Mycena vulgaris]